MAYEDLKITREETNQVKKFKINIVVHNCQLFYIKDLKIIVEMFTCLINIINEFQTLGKTYVTTKKIMKILMWINIKGH